MVFSCHLLGTSLDGLIKEYHIKEYHYFVRVVALVDLHVHTKQKSLPQNIQCVKTPRRDTQACGDEMRRAEAAARYLQGRGENEGFCILMGSVSPWVVYFFFWTRDVGDLI